MVYDTWDDGDDQQAALTEHLGLDTIRAYFKREMLACARYGPRTFPLPLAYSDARIPASIPSERPHGVFFAGNRLFGLRRLYLEYLEQRLGYDFSREFAPEEYAEGLLRSRIGLDFFGFGFDTVRYWELAAHGCMILSERKPVCIPHNFVEGESAVFFDDLPDLENKLRYYREHPQEAQAIAEAGRRHFLAHHTSTARARQFLGRVEPLVRQ